MPIAEMRVRLQRLAKTVKHGPNDWDLADLSMLATTDPAMVIAIKNGKPFTPRQMQHWGENARRRLSRWIMIAEQGQIVKKDYLFKILDKPRWTMPAVGRIVLTPAGVSMMAVERRPNARMPGFAQVFMREPKNR